MRVRNILSSALILVVLSGAALAADITGSWSGTMSMGDNQFTLTYSFKQEAGKLSGTVLTPQGDTLPLSEGTVDGDKVSFTIKVDMNGSTVKFVSNGTIKGEEITITTKSEGGHDFPETAMTLKRSH
jgi:hypothetical protein